MSEGTVPCPVDISRFGRSLGYDARTNHLFVLQILIRNIDRTLTQPEIVCHFRKYGKVRSCELVKDVKTGESKGFAFAEMPKLDEAMKAIEELNGMKLGDSVLRVKRAANSTVAKKEAKLPPKPDFRRGRKGSSRSGRPKRA